MLELSVDFPPWDVILPRWGTSSVLGWSRSSRLSFILQMRSVPLPLHIPTLFPGLWQTQLIYLAEDETEDISVTTSLGMSALVLGAWLGGEDTF